MTDAELMNALVALARRAGLIAPTQTLLILDERQWPMCGKVGPVKDMAADLCGKPLGHAGRHDWDTGHAVIDAFDLADRP